MRPFLFVALVHLLLAPAAMADVWRWTDAEGVIRYTPDPDRVPARSRGTLVQVTPGMAPTATAAPAEEPEWLPPADEFDADPFNAPQRARSVEVTVVPEPAWEVKTRPSGAAAASTASPARGAGGREDAARTGSNAATPSTGTAGAVVASAPPQSSPSLPPVSSSPAGPAAAPASAATGTSVPTAGDASASAPNPSIASAASPPVDPWSALAVVGGVVSPPPWQQPAPAPLTAEQISRRDELEALIDRDEEILKQLLSDPSLDASGFEESPELREIALRLPALQAELRALKEGRAPEAPEAP